MSFYFGIRKKLTLSFLLLVVLISVVFALTSYLSITRSMHAEIEKHGIAVVKTFSQLAAPYIFESDYVTIYDNAYRLIENSDILVVSIIDRQGKTWLTTDQELNHEVSLSPFYLHSIDNRSIGHRKVMRDGQGNMEFISPITALGEVLYLLKIEISLKSIKKQTFERLRDAVIIGLVMLVAAALLGAFLSKLLTDSLEKLVQGTNQISKGNLSYRIPVASSDEIGTLSRSFNLMTDTLEKELSIRKRAELKLKAHRDRLEETVALRTAQLTKINTRISQEVEEHKKTEQALRESEERYRRFSEVTIDGIVFHDQNGIIDTNSTFLRLFGYSRGELEGKDLIDHICPVEQQDATREVIFSDPDKFVEIVGIRKDGTEMPIEMYSRKLELNNVNLTVTAVRDITERKLLEKQLYQAQKMESIGLMAGGVAHDLNNILSGIVSYPEFILMELPDDSKLRQPLEVIKESGSRAAEVVADLLTVARGVASSRELRNPNRLITEYLNSPEFKRIEDLYPGMSINTDLNENVSNFYCSPTHVSKSIMNLVANAAESVGKEGVVSIQTTNLSIDSTQGAKLQLKAGSYIQITVSDSGSGISEEDIQHIFDPFYSKKKMGKSSGSGLGLTVVWNTVQDHDGCVMVESSEQGTTFTMYFPSTSEKFKTPANIRNIGNLHGKGECLLIVDDEERQRVITSQMLSSLGYRVHAVDSGEEAVAFLETISVDLILLDMLLGEGMSGRQTFSAIKKKIPDQKAIIVSGFSDDVDVRETQKLGAGHFVKKPFTLQQIGIAIQQELHS